ncbi:MAG TPA: hypothetical protein ENK52_05945 [Saprospiraceae bacterium]|nr:hypothetical protein [Saprospiraceae bacterium]
MSSASSTSYPESGLLFSFPKNWRVFKFDDHRFYRYVSGYGIKGVDFIGITEEKRLVLIEVKNYTDRFPQDGIDPIQKIKKAPLDFAEQITLKFEDSFSLINGIHRFHQKQTWYRWLARPLLHILPQYISMKYDWGFWSISYQLLKNHQTDLVLWLELGTKISCDAEKKLKQEIASYFKKEFKSKSIVIANRKNPFQKIEAHLN